MAYINLDKITEAPHIENIVFTEDVTNGVFANLGDLSYDGEVVHAVKGGDQTKELVLHASNGLVYDERKTELDFVLKAGKVGRGYVLKNGNVISFTKDLFAGNVAKGNLVKPNAQGLLAVSADVEAGELHGRVMGTEYDFIAGEMVIVRFEYKKA